eukprot:m.259020 g.259020  ORF g.259020 m.259020 type:complete len:159 (+) comp15973_c0_seq6:136-612(+)
MEPSLDRKLAKVQKRLRTQTEDPESKSERKRRNKEKHLKEEAKRAQKALAKDIIAARLEASPVAITDRFSSTSASTTAQGLTTTTYGLQTKAELEAQAKKLAAEKELAEQKIRDIAAAEAEAEVLAKKHAAKTKKLLKAKNKLNSMAKLSFADDDDIL